MIPLIAFGSGVAALIYEVVWFQLLELVIGSSAISLAVLLATFMGGMCLGSILLPVVVSANRNPMRVYAAIELCIGVLGVVVLIAMPSVAGVYAAAYLLPPTLLMGATLPALARSVKGAPPLGFLYAANIAGAVFGSLLTGFYLLRVFDVSAATYAAVAINIVVALIALASSSSGARTPACRVETHLDTSEPRVSGSGSVYVAIALSGLCALGGEAIWTRTLGLILGASVYTLAIILAVFLTGLGIGSAIGSRLCRTLIDTRAALGWCQMLAAAAIAWTAYTLNASLPYWPIDPSVSAGIAFNFELDLVRAFYALLPPTVLWGASFPLALAAASPQAQDSASLMGKVYAANTVGAIIGALGAGLFLVPWIGSQGAQQVLIALSACSALFLLPKRWLLAPAVALLTVLLIRTVPPIAPVLIAHGRYSATWAGKADIPYAKEGITSSVAVSSFPDGVLTFHVAGKIQASNVPRDLRLQRMLGHLTTLAPATPRSVLVIGCGAGITAGAVSIDPRVERVTIAEIEPLVPEAAATYFKESNFDVVHNPKVRVRIADGRHYLMTSKENFDAITVDPLDPWVKGAANLYTKEFYEAAKRRLNPGGVITMYIQLFETNADAVKSSIATFFEVFPHGVIFGNTYDGQGHDMILLAQAEPLHIDLDDMEERFKPVSESLAEVGMDSPIDLFATYAGRKRDLGEWLNGAAINRDSNLRMQYLAGFGLNLDDSAKIYADLLTYQRLPEDLFTSTEGRTDSLRRALQRQNPALH